MSKKTRRIVTRVDEPMYDAVLQKANKDAHSISFLVRRLLALWLTDVISLRLPNQENPAKRVKGKRKRGKKKEKKEAISQVEFLEEEKPEEGFEEKPEENNSW